MSEPPSSAFPHEPASKGRVEHAPTYLNGVLERHAFPPLLTAVFAVIGSLLLYQFIGALALLVLLLQQGIPPADLLGGMERLFAEQAEGVLVTNAVAQVLGLAIPAVLFARLHTARVGIFLRFQAPDTRQFTLALLGLVALTPVVFWLGAFNETLPIPQPEWMRELEEAQVELLERVLREDASLVVNLLLMAVTPAFCEEVLFRGYVQRQAERGLGTLGGILFSGIVFGLYHFRLSQIIPLSVLGLYLAYLVWRTGSLWPAVAVHFANNALAVWLSPHLEPSPGVNVNDVEKMGVPGYLLSAGLVFFIGIIYALQQTAKTPPADRAAGQGP